MAIMAAGQRRANRWLAAIWPIAITAATALAGCAAGDEGSPGGEAASSAAKRAFMASASAICINEKKGADWRGKAYRRKHADEHLSEAALAEATRKGVLLLTVEAEISSIGALTPPPGDGRRIATMLKDLEVVVGEARKKAKTEEEARRYLGSVDSDFHAYGLRVCAHGP